MTVQLSAPEIASSEPGSPTALPAADISTIPQRVVAAWADNDADAFASVFTEHATMILVGNVFVTGRENIRKHMAEAFAGQYAGTRVTGTPIAIRPIARDIVLLITRGGVIPAGETELPASEAIRASWLVVRQDGEWKLTAYQNTAIAS